MKFSNISLFVVLVLFVLSSCKKEDDDLLGPQPPVPQEIALAEVLAGSIEVQLNPYDNAPLAALVELSGKNPMTVHFQIDDGLNIQHQTDSFMLDHKFALLGLKPGHINQVIFTFTLADHSFAKDTVLMETAPLPDYFPNIQILQQQTSKMEAGLHFCEFSYSKNNYVHTRPFIFDQEGTIRWYLEIEALSTFFYPVKRLRNGNWIFGHLNTIYEYNMLGKEVNRWELDDYSQHHEIVEKEDGNFILAVSDKRLATDNDQIIEIDRNSGAIVKNWDLRTILDNDRFPILWNSRDWLHVNSIWFDEADQSLVISGRHQGIFKVSYNNELIWILAPHHEWGQAGVNGDGFATTDYLLTATDNNNLPYPEAVQKGELRAEDFDWTWGQHSVMVTTEGQIFAFDNGFKRNFQNNISTTNHSRGVAYMVNENNQTVQQVWEFGKALNASFYSRTVSDIDFLPNTGNRLIISGNIHNEGSVYAQMVEVSTAGEVVFEAKINFANIYGSGNDAWGQTDVVYRGERIGLYP